MRVARIQIDFSCPRPSLSNRLCVCSSIPPPHSPPPPLISISYNQGLLYGQLKLPGYSVNHSYLRYPADFKGAQKLTSRATVTDDCSHCVDDNAKSIGEAAESYLSEKKRRMNVIELPICLSAKKLGFRRLRGAKKLHCLNGEQKLKAG